MIMKHMYTFSFIFSPNISIITYYFIQNLHSIVLSMFLSVRVQGHTYILNIKHKYIQPSHLFGGGTVGTCVYKTANIKGHRLTCGVVVSSDINSNRNI